MNREGEANPDNTREVNMFTAIVALATLVGISSAAALAIVPFLQGSGVITPSKRSLFGYEADKR